MVAKDKLPALWSGSQAKSKPVGVQLLDPIGDDKITKPVAGVGHPRTLPHRVVAAGVFALCGPHGVSKTLTGQVRAPICSVRLTVRTPGFHPGNRGSIPLRSTIGVSFNGRTLVFGTSHGGSTPSTPTTLLSSLPLPVFFSFLFGW